MCGPASWQTETELSSTFFSEPFGALNAMQTFQWRTHFQRTGLSTTRWTQTFWSTYSWHDSRFPLRLHLQKVYFNISPPKPQTPRITPHCPFFTALEKHDLTLPQPKVTWSVGGLRLRLHPGSSLSSGRMETLLRRPFPPLPMSCFPLLAPRVLWPVLWD